MEKFLDLLDQTIASREKLLDGYILMYREFRLGTPDAFFRAAEEDLFEKNGNERTFTKSIENLHKALRLLSMSVHYHAVFAASQNSLTFKRACAVHSSHLYFIWVLLEMFSHPEMESNCRLAALDGAITHLILGQHNPKCVEKLLACRAEMFPTAESFVRPPDGTAVNDCLPYLLTEDEFHEFRRLAER